MSTLKEKVEQWIAAGCNYNDGLMLLQQNSNKRALIKHLSRGEASPEKLEHLKYNLIEVVSISSHEAAMLNPIPEITLRADDIDAEAQKKQNYPNEVIALKAIKTKLYNERAVIHKKYLEIGKANDPKSIAKRKAIYDRIASITAEFFETDAKIQAIFDTLAGKLPLAPEPTESNNSKITPEEVLKLQKELTNNIAYISKNKDLKKFADKCEERKARNEEIKQLLEGLQ